MGQPRKFPLLATIMMLCGVGVLGALGNWQLERLTWKENLLSTIVAQGENPDRTFTANDLTQQNEFQTGTISGTFLNNKTFSIVPRTYDGKPGAHVITPFAINDGNIVLVNRGWMPVNPDDITLKTPQTITGIIRQTPRPNMFTPLNDITSGEWYRVDMGDVKAAHGLENIAPVMLYETCADSASGLVPNPCALTLNINNNHKQYAFFWFSMAFILIVIYGLRFWRKPTA